MKSLTPSLSHCKTVPTDKKKEPVINSYFSWLNWKCKSWFESTCVSMYACLSMQIILQLFKIMMLYHPTQSHFLFDPYQPFGFSSRNI